MRQLKDHHLTIFWNSPLYIVFNTNKYEIANCHQNKYVLHAEILSFY